LLLPLKADETYKAFVNPGDILVELIPLAGKQYAKRETITTPPAKQQTIK
jgi:hypothetical protein